MSLFNEEELAMIAIALDEEEEADDQEDYQQAIKRIWVCELWENRETEGEYHTLCQKLTRHPKYYYDYFKMSESTFHRLLQKLQDALRKKDTYWRQSITPMERLAVTLRFLTTGDSFKTIAFSYRMGFSTVQEIVTKTCKCIVDTMMSEMLPRPTNETWKSIADDFNTLWNFPNCIGALDGKHFTIQSPPSSGSLYFSYKKTFSVVLMALVDANYNFTIVNVGSYGKNSDGGIFANSNLGKELQRNNLSLPEASNLPGSLTTAPYVIVGDEAFPLKSYLMRPYPGTNLSTDKRIFNYRLSRARRVVENTFGQLTSKFRIYNRRIQALPKNVDNIILSTCILHNFIKKYDKETNRQEREVAGTNETHTAYEDLPPVGLNASREAFLVRDTFKSYFISPVGAVPWQNNRI